MKKLLAISILIAAFLFSGCKKEGTADLAGENSFHGVVMLEDPLTSNFALTNVGVLPVYLRYAEDTTGFLNNVNSDVKGQYAFYGIDNSRNYSIYAFLDGAKLKYSASRRYTAGTYTVNPLNDTLILKPAAKNQNGIFYRLFDNKEGSLQNCTLYIFSSQVLYNAGDPVGATYTLTSDASGRCLQMNVAPGTYYVRAKGVYGAVNLAATGSVKVEKEGIAINTLVLN